MSKYQIIIEYNKESSSFSGSLFTGKESIPFDPTTILARLNYKREPANISDLYFDDWDYEYEYGFGKKIKIANREQYYKLVIAIRKLILASYESHTVLNSSNIDVLRLYFDISNSFTASKTIPRELRVRIDEKNTYKLPIKRLPDINVNFHYSNYSLESALTENLSSFQSYYYEGDTLADVIYSILHFQSIRGMKYCKCIHCSSFFATSSEKNKYCKQKSPYPGYIHLNCEQAIRNINQQINRKYKRIYNNLSQNHAQEKNKLLEFTDEFYQFSSVMHKEPTPENIDLVFEILETSKWY